MVAVLSFLMMSTNLLGLNIQAGFNSFKMLDVKLFYTLATFNNTISSFTAPMRIAYLNLHLMDYVFILSFYPFLALTLFTLVQKDKHHIWWVAFPLFAMGFDFLENIMIDIRMLTDTTHPIYAIVGFLTLFKFVFLITSIILIVTQIRECPLRKKYGSHRV